MSLMLQATNSSSGSTNTHTVMHDVPSPAYSDENAVRSSLATYILMIFHQSLTLVSIPRSTSEAST